MPTSKLDGTGKRILVIDDDLAIRVLLQAVLKWMKFDVAVAEDGLAGLDVVQQNGGFDLDRFVEIIAECLNGDHQTLPARTPPPTA